MKTITVREVINDTLPVLGWEAFRIYIFRDGDFVLYVGRTDQNIIDRLEDHLGLTYHAESQVGRLIEQNAPESYDWCIDLLSLEECRTIIKRHFPESRGIDVAFAERAVILDFSPPLNGQSNPHPRVLPTKYTERRDAQLLSVHRKVFHDKR